MWCMKFCFLVPSPTPKPNPKKDRQSNETGIWSDPDIFVRKNSTVWRKSCFGCLRWSLNPPKHAHAHRKSTWQTWCCQHIGPCIQECSCVSSDKYFSAARSFGDCAAFCAAQKFPRFHYETTADATGTCACCTFGGIPGTEASTGSVYTYADNATVVVETSHGMAPCFLPLLSLMSLSLLWPGRFTLFHIVSPCHLNGSAPVKCWKYSHIPAIIGVSLSVQQVQSENLVKFIWRIIILFQIQFQAFSKFVFQPHPIASCSAVCTLYISRLCYCF